MKRSLQHLCSTLHYGNSDPGGFESWEFFGIINDPNYIGSRCDGNLYGHNEEGPLSIASGTNLDSDCYCLFDIQLTKEQWEKQVKEIKKTEHDIKFNEKFEDLIK